MAADSETAAPVGKEISGTVRIIRSQPQTEVFFKDLKESVIIPVNSRHNQIYEACEKSWKKGTPVKLRIDPVSRHVLALPGSESGGGEALKPSTLSPDFKPLPEDSSK